MPSPNKRPTPPAAKPVARPKDAGPVKYPELKVGVGPGAVLLTDALVTIDFRTAVALFGYLPEDEYLAARIKADPSLGVKADALRYGSDFLAENCLGQKVRAVNNRDNRPFDLPTANGYKQEHLKRRWKLNGETIIVGRRGNVMSGQHRLWGFVDAVLEWRRDPHWRQFWPEEPVMRTVVLTGVDDDPETVATLDNVRPRSLADTIYTSPIFAKLEAGQRKECSRMLDVAVDLFWKRTDAAHAGHAPGDGRVFQTHQASHDLLDRHPRLKDAVKHLFEENQSRTISVLKLSPGQCAALCYLMAASATDPEKYEEGGRKESACDFRHWDRATEFWAAVSGKGPTLAPMKKVLAAVVNGDFGGLELNDKKLAVVVKAWNEFVAGKDGSLKEATLVPDVGENARGDKVLTEFPTVGGLDLGQRPDPKEQMTEEEVEAAVEADRERRREERARELEARKTGSHAPSLILAAIDAVRTAHPGRILLFAVADGSWSAWGKDAGVVGEVEGLKSKERPDNLVQVKVPADRPVEEVARRLRLKGHAVAKVLDEGKTVVDLLPDPGEKQTAEAAFKAKQKAATPGLNGTTTVTPLAPTDRCPNAKDGRHAYLPGPGNVPAKACSLCSSPRPKDAPKAPAKRGGTGK